MRRTPFSATQLYNEAKQTLKRTPVRKIKTVREAVRNETDSFMAAAIGMSAGLFALPLARARQNKTTRMHEMMKSGGPKANKDDSDTSACGDAKGMTPRHCREITGALAANIAGASAIAKDSSGGTLLRTEVQCRTEMTKQPDFIKFGKAVHLKADELSGRQGRGQGQGPCPPIGLIKTATPATLPLALRLGS